MSRLALLFSLFLIFSALITVDASAIPVGGAIKRAEGAAAKVKRDVWAPKITDPKEGSVWRVGDRVTVTWDTKNPPSQITNTNGMLALRTTNGFLQGPGGLGEPLARNFSIFLGSVEVEVPEIPARDDYQVVLFGDSGNTSPFFMITNSMFAPAPL